MIDPTAYAVPKPRIAAAFRTLADAAIRSLRAHRVYLCLIVAYLPACLVAAWLTGGGEVVKIRLYAVEFVELLAAFALAVVLGHAVWTMVFVRPTGSLAEAIWRDFRARFLSPRRLTDFLVAAVPIPLFLSIFSSFKRMIPYANPYSWDSAFMELDRWLHGGYHPWELLQPILGAPFLTSAINFPYNLWIFVTFFTLIWQTFSQRDPALRMRFLVSFLLCWMVLGTVFATLLASGGPCFYGRMTGLEDPFQPLMQYLYAVNEHYPVWSLTVQERLWATHESAGSALGHGISAMPSLHVATSVLFALLGWRIGRIVGIAYTVNALLVLVGSVHLGWHYAIDGYAAAAAAALIWWAVGGWTGRGQAL